jgi:hypothetical protein
VCVTRTLSLPRAQEEKRLATVKEEQNAAREARVVPSEPAKLVEFLLNTTAEEMDFELVRCRPHLARAHAARTRTRDTHEPKPRCVVLLTLFLPSLSASDVHLLRAPHGRHPRREVLRALPPGPHR